MEKFCKLFEFEDIGQVLVMLEEGDDGPEVRFTFQGGGLLGLCCTSFSKFGGEDVAGDSDEAWSLAAKTLEETTEQIAYQLVTNALRTPPFSMFAGAALEEADGGADE